MTCKQVRHLLVSCWGEVEQLEAEAAAHLAECQECWREAEMLRLTHGLLREAEAEREAAPAGFAQRVMAQVSEAEPTGVSWYQRALGWLAPPAPAFGRVRAAAVAMAVVLVLGGGLALYRGAAGPTGVSPDAALVVGVPHDEDSAGEATIDFEALVLHHETLALTQALSEDVGVHLVSYRY